MVKKIRLSASYDTSENLTKRLLEQFLTPDINLGDVEFVYDDSYDVIVFFKFSISVSSLSIFKLVIFFYFILYFIFYFIFLIL